MRALSRAYNTWYIDTSSGRVTGCLRVWHIQQQQQLHQVHLLLSSCICIRSVYCHIAVRSSSPSAEHQL